MSSSEFDIGMNFGSPVQNVTPNPVTPTTQALTFTSPHGSIHMLSNQANQQYINNQMAQQAAALNMFGPLQSYNATITIAQYQFPDLKTIEDGGIRAGEIIGHRVWYVIQGFLRSVAMGYTWLPYEPARGDVSNGGVHAFKDIRDAYRYVGLNGPMTATVFGKVALWGTVVEHEKGYRAEYAKVVSLDRIWHAVPTLLDEVRNTYGISEKT